MSPTSKGKKVPFDRRVCGIQSFDENNVAGKGNAVFHRRIKSSQGKRLRGHARTRKP